MDPREVEMLQQYLNSFTQQIEAYSRQLEMIEQRRVESFTAVETISSLAEGNSNTVLLQLGGGASIRVNVIDADKVLLNIGSDVIVERSGAETIEYLQDRVKEMEAVEKKIAASIGQVQKQAQDVAKRIETAYQQAARLQMPQEGRAGN